MHGGWGSSIDPHRARVSTETYWAIRRCSTNVRSWMTVRYPGKKGGRYADLYTLAEMVDIGCDAAYQRGGLPALAVHLATDDNVEHMLSRIGAEVALCRSGDITAFQDLLTSRPPGNSDILPHWRLGEARDYSKQLHLQRARAGRAQGNVVTFGDGDDDGDDHAVAPRRRRNRKPKPKAGAAAAGGDAGGKGGGGKGSHQ